MVKDQSIQITREETLCHHYMGHTFQLTAREPLYAPTHRQDSTYHDPCTTSRISRSSQCSITSATKTMICTIMSVR